MEFPDYDIDEILQENEPVDVIAWFHDAIATWLQQPEAKEALKSRWFSSSFECDLY